MLTFMAVALAGGAAAVAAGWARRRVDELGRPRRFPWVSVAALVALAVAAAVPGVVRAHQERRLGRAASVLAEARVAVRCQTLGGAFLDGGPELGYVRWRPDGSPEPWALLKRDQCHHLAGYLRSDRHRPTRDQVIAVHVLTHEAMHLSGRLGEAEAECAAVQRDAETARLLGSPPVAAAALAGLYWRELDPLMPDRYRSPECRAGGSLDEHRADAPWLAPLPVELFDTAGAAIPLEKERVMLGAVPLGLVAGVVARMLVPGDVFRNMSGPASWLASIALGLAGAIVGYLIFTVGLGIGDTEVFDWGGSARRSSGRSRPGGGRLPGPPPRRRPPLTS